MYPVNPKISSIVFDYGKSGFLGKIKSKFNNKNEELVFSKKIQDFLLSFPNKIGFEDRKRNFNDAFIQLRKFANNVGSTEQRDKIHSIIMNLGGARLEAVLNELESFIKQHGSNRYVENVGGYICSVDRDRIGAYSYEEISEGLKECDRLMSRLIEVEKSTTNDYFNKNIYLDHIGLDDGLKVYKKCFEERKQDLDETISEQKGVLKKIIESACGWGGAALSSSRKVDLHSKLAKVREKLKCVEGERAFKALGMQGYGCRVSAFLDGVARYIDTGFPSPALLASDLYGMNEKDISVASRAQGVQQGIIDLLDSLGFKDRKSALLDAFGALKKLKLQATSSPKDQKIIGAVAANLGGLEFKALLSDMEAFFDRHGKQLQADVPGLKSGSVRVDEEKIQSYTLAEVKDALGELERIQMALRKIEREDMRAVFDSKVYLGPAIGSDDGLEKYEACLKAKRNAVE